MQRELSLMSSRQLCRALGELVLKMLLIFELQVQMAQAPLTL